MLGVIIGIGAFTFLAQQELKKKKDPGDEKIYTDCMKRGEGDQVFAGGTPGFYDDQQKEKEFTILPHPTPKTPQLKDEPDPLDDEPTLNARDEWEKRMKEREERIRDRERYLKDRISLTVEPQPIHRIK